VSAYDHVKIPHSTPFLKPPINTTGSPREISAATIIIPPPLDHITLPPYEEGTPPADKPRLFYHDSTEEALLEAQLRFIKKSGTRIEIRKARENLRAYWRKIIDEDYEGILQQHLPGEIQSLTGLYNDNPYDLIVQYRLRTLALRAGVLGDADGVREIERISRGALRKSSPTGMAIAEYAKNR